MDLSEEYIKMATAATEIQSMVERGIVFLTDKDFIHGENTWLPRQDQLQPMVIQKITMLPIGFREGTIVCNLYNPKEIQKWDSLEQLWLALVMKMNFKKHWDYKDHAWVDAKPKSNLILPN